jgi:hypothetical protein
MSGELHAAQGFPLTLSLSNGERKAFFNGLLRFRSRLETIGPARGVLARRRAFPAALATLLRSMAMMSALLYSGPHGPNRDGGLRQAIGEHVG